MDITDLRRKDFETWIASHNTKSFDKQDEELLKNGLTKIGITIQSIYNVDDSFSVRLYASELLLKRKLCGIYDFDRYTKALQRLVSYAEYLDEYTKKEKDFTVSTYPSDNISESDTQIVEDNGIEENQKNL